MPTALTLYLANAASTTIGTANQLYHSGAGSPTTGQPITTMGTAVNYGEVLSQGGSAWAASGSIGTPTGKGFFLDDTTLDGQDIVSGSYSATLRLVAMQSGSQAGSMTADIIVRLFRYRPSTTTYTQIVAMTLTGQTINAVLTNYSLSGSTGSNTSFIAGDKLYCDCWLNITAGSGNAAQGVRINRLTTDTATFIGDALASVATPGYQSGAVNFTTTITEQLTSFKAEATTSSFANLSTTITEQLSSFSGEASANGSQSQINQLASFSAEATTTASFGSPTTPGVSVQVASNSVLVREGSFEIDDSINAMSTCSFTIRDDSGANHYQKGQQVSVTDHYYGLMFTGNLNSVEEQNVYPNAMIMSRTDSTDNHYYPGKRTYIGDEYEQQYAGAIATDLLNLLTAEGITAQFASRRDTTLAQFALGTLSNTVATTNDQGDGDLELALAGVTYKKIETTTADFAGGSLSGVVASNNALQITPLTALRLRGTAASSITDCYTYRKIWNSSGGITINSGDQLFYSIWISSTSPESKSGVQIYCSDGTTFNNNSTVADQYNIFATPQSDISIFAQDQWMDRYFDLSPLAGKTIKQVAVALEGNNSGTYNSYFRNIQLLTSGFSVRQNFFTTSRQTDIQLSNVGYKSVSTAVVTVSAGSGSRISPTYNIASVNIVRGSQIDWSATTQTQASSATNTSQQVTISASIDNGATWQACTNHQPIPCLIPGMNAATLLLKEDLNVGGPNPELTPYLNELSFSIDPSYATTKNDVRDTDQSSADFNGGSLTNLSATANGLMITGDFRTWDDSSLSSQVLFGSGNPAHFDSYGTLALRCDNIAEVRSRLDFAGPWQNFMLEIDVQIPDSGNANYGVTYRTTNWSNTNDTYAYNAFLTPTAVTLAKGTNGGGGGFTQIATVAVTFNSNAWYRLKVIANGSNHQVYVDDVLYINATDSTYSSSGMIAVRHFNNTGNRHSAFFNNFGVMNLSLTGTRTVTAMTNGALSLVGTVGNSIIQWQSDEPANTALLIEASTDGGGSWSTCTNGAAIPGLTTGTVIGAKSLQLRQTFTTGNANATPTLFGLTTLVIGAFAASGTRVSPALNLLNVGRLGNSLIAWNAILPPGCTLGVDTTINGGGTWTDVSSQNGGSIPGLTVQPDAWLDTFDSNTAANYSNINGSGSMYALRAFAGPVPLNGAWTYDIAHSRLNITATALSLLIYGAQTATDLDIQMHTDYSDTSGMVYRYTNISNYYDMVVQDGSSSGGSANTVAIFKVSSGVRTPLASASITFTRGTFKLFKVTMLAGVITVYMDGDQILIYTDGSPLSSGKCGLRSGVGSAHIYQLRIQPLGQDVTAVSVITRFRLASTNPAYTPQVLDSTLAAYGNTIAKGALIPATQYNFKYLSDCFDDLVKQSASATGNQWWWYIDRFKKFSMLPQTGLPAPWIGSDNPGDFLVGVKVTNLSDLYRNRQIIKNVIATIAIDEKHQGDDVARSWTLGYALAEAPTITVNDIPVAIGVKGTDTGKDLYYAIGDPVITQDSSGTLFTSDQTLHIVGTGQYITYSQYDDLVEQAAFKLIEGGSGIVENVEDGNGMSKDAGDQLAKARVKQYGVRGKKLEATTRRYGLAPGQILSVSLPQYSLLDAQFLIRNVKTTLTTEYDITQAAMIQHGWYAIEAVSGADEGEWVKLFQRDQ